MLKNPIRQILNIHHRPIIFMGCAYALIPPQRTNSPAANAMSQTHNRNPSVRNGLNREALTVIAQRIEGPQKCLHRYTHYSSEQSKRLNRFQQ
jgi:hypothetical protein